MAVIKNNRILKCLLMIVVCLLLVLNFSIGVSASTNYDRQEADACITISQRFSVKGGSEAQELVQYDKLREYYRQAEKYGTGSIRELEDGRIRFYEELKPASKPGEMVGAKHVRE